MILANQDSPPHNTGVTPMTILEKIKAHEQDILSGKVTGFLEICPQCDSRPVSFKIHEYKNRLFLVIDKSFVSKIEAALARIKCPVCKRSFTYYPDFALPYKRYVKDNILEICEAYVENDESTYNDMVHYDDIQIAYEDNEDVIDNRYLDRSTVWRWIAFIGSLNSVLNNTLKLIRQRSATSPVFRRIHIPHPGKYRSNRRRLVLQQSMRLLDAAKEFICLFNTSIFPDFATASVLK